MALRTGRDGETGRRSGLKIRRPERVVGVQVPLPAPTINPQCIGRDGPQAKQARSLLLGQGPISVRKEFGTNSTRIASVLADIHASVVSVLVLPPLTAEEQIIAVATLGPFLRQRNQCLSKRPEWRFDYFVWDLWRTTGAGTHQIGCSLPYTATTAGVAEPGQSRMVILQIRRAGQRKLACRTTAVKRRIEQAHIQCQ